MTADSNFWNPPPTLLGSIALAAAIYFRSVYYFWPQKFSPKFTPRLVNWLTAIIALCGIGQIIIATFTQTSGK